MFTTFISSIAGKITIVAVASIALLIGFKVLKSRYDNALIAPYEQQVLSLTEHIEHMKTTHAYQVSTLENKIKATEETLARRTKEKERLNNYALKLEQYRPKEGESEEVPEVYIQLFRLLRDGESMP